MAFLFKMQKILDYREQQEEQAKVALARVQHMYDEAEKQLAVLKAELTAKETQLYTCVEMDSGERWLLENFVKGLRSDVESAHLRLRTLAQMVEEARVTLQIRAKEHKVLDKLRERQHEQYLRDEREKERKSNDETATLRRKIATF